MAKQTNCVVVPRSIVRVIEVLAMCLLLLNSHISSNTTNANKGEVIFCMCDLNKGACDVNCCCDPDCTLADQQAFSRCTNYYNPSTRDDCVQRSIVFIDNSPFVINTSQQGLLCIHSDNFPRSRTFLNVSVINTRVEFDHYMRRYGKHYFRRQHETLRIANMSYYKSGDPVLVVHDNLAVGVLSLPRGLASESCVDANPVSYMIPQKFSCTRPQTDIQLQCRISRMWSASAYYKGFKVVKNPEVFSNIYGNFTHDLDQYAYYVIMREERVLHHMPPDIEDPLTQRFVLPPLYNSSYVTRVWPDENSACFSTDGERHTCAGNPNGLPSPSLEDSNHEFVCANVVSKVKYTIVYVNTEGIQHVRVHFILRDITEKDLPLRQSFEVTYAQPSRILPISPVMMRLESDEKGDKSFSGKPVKYSGNPGYVVGEPLRVGTLKIGDQWKRSAIKIIDDDRRGLTMLTSGLNGDCQTTQSREPVRFGINMRSGCFVRFKFTDMSEACNQSQWATWIALRGQDPPTHVATFGNSDPHIVGDWVKILEVDARPHADSAVYDDHRPGICFNVLSGLDIQIIFAKIGSYDNPQAQIIGARFNYIYMNYLQCQGPSCRSSASAWEQRFEVASSVTFTDASKAAVGVEAAVEKPRISVPINFFYPFGSDDE